MALPKIQGGVTPKTLPKELSSPAADPRPARLAQLYTEAKTITDGPGNLSTKATLLGAKLEEIHDLKTELRSELPKDQQVAALKIEIAQVGVRNATLRKNDPAVGPLTKQLMAQNDTQLLELEGELRALTAPKAKGDAVDAKKVAAPTTAQSNVAQTKATNEAQSFAALQSRSSGGLFGFTETPSPKQRRDDAFREVLKLMDSGKSGYDALMQVAGNLKSSPELESLRQDILKVASEQSQRSHEQLMAMLRSWA